MKSILIMLLVPFMVNCAGKKKAAVAKTEVAQTQKIMNDSTPVTVADTLPLIVQFYSIGEGINSSSKNKLDDFINAEQKIFNQNISYQVVRWGREGEFDACFRLSNLSAGQRNTFIAELKKIFNDKSLVHILQNQNCKYIR